MFAPVNTYELSILYIYYLYYTWKQEGTCLKMIARDLKGVYIFTKILKVSDYFYSVISKYAFFSKGQKY